MQSVETMEKRIKHYENENIKLYDMIEKCEKNGWHHRIDGLLEEIRENENIIMKYATKKRKALGY